MLQDYFFNLINKSNNITGRAFAGKYGWIKLGFFSMFVSLFFAFPSYDLILKGKAEFWWKSVIEQTREPFVQKSYWAGSHDAKLAFRLTPPLIGKVLGLNRNGYLLLQISFFAMFFFLLTRTLLSLTSDIVSTAYLSLGFATTFVGSVLVSDYRGLFDGIAYTFMLMAMCWRNPLLIFAAAFLASFTDERALVAMPLILLYLIVRESNIKELDLKFLIKGDRYSWAVAASCIAYTVCRLLLAQIFGLKTNSADEHIWLIGKQIDSWAIGLWTGLEGFWLVIIAAGMILLLTKRYAALLATGVAALMVFLVAANVLDITRSMAYMFPLAILSVCIIEKTEKKHANYLYFAAMIISALPSYNIVEESTFTMFHPLLVQILRMFFTN